MNVTIATRGIDALNRNVARFPKDTAEDYQQGKLVGRESSYFVRKEITAAGRGIFEMFVPADLETDGIRNIDRGRLAQGKNFAIESIRLSEGNSAAVVNPAAIVNYTNLITSVQAELRNAMLFINQAGKRLVELPISILLNQAAGFYPGKDDAYNLDNPPVLVEAQPFEIQIKLPATYAAASASANKFHIEVILNGKRTDPAYV